MSSKPPTSPLPLARCAQAATAAAALLVATHVDPWSPAFLVAAETCMLAAAGLAAVVIERITPLRSAALGASLPLSPVAQS
ncbi:hypothetical protein [Actinacidiphila sp. bgisy160]|uniref:hypothetical protein n=1 Tax=Actinacidiphila sp. bgisy160 TaxID=3413796 RepID=UPI003D72F113